MSEIILEELKKQTAILNQILAQQNASSSYQWTPEGLPICPKHNEVMPKREKQGDVWYSHKIIDEQGEVFYCKGYHSKSSPGFDIEAASAADPADTCPEEPADLSPAEYRAAEARRRRSGEIRQPNQPSVVVEFNARDAFYKLASEAMATREIASEKINELVALGDFRKAYQGLQTALAA